MGTYLAVLLLPDDRDLRPRRVAASRACRRKMRGCGAAPICGDHGRHGRCWRTSRAGSDCAAVPAQRAQRMARLSPSARRSTTATDQEDRGGGGGGVVVVVVVSPSWRDHPGLPWTAGAGEARAHRWNSPRARPGASRSVLADVLRIFARGQPPRPAPCRAHMHHLPAGPMMFRDRRWRVVVAL